MKTLKTRISILLCLCMVVPTILGMLPNLSTYATAEAATKATIDDWNKNKTIGIQGTSESIWISNTKEGAKYTYTSSNTKVVKVSVNKYDPSYASIKGLKTGSAKITIKEKYKNKTTKVGTIKVKVVKASVNKDAICNISIGKPKWNNTLASDYFIPQMNYKATYKFTSSDPDKLSIKSDGTIVNAKAAGSVQVSVTETYKKKTRNLGDITVTVNEPTMSGNQIVTVTSANDYVYFTNYLSYAEDHEFDVTITDASGKDASSYLKEFYYDDDATWYYIYTTNGITGTIYLKIHDKTADMDLGTLTVNIVDSFE